MPAFQFDLESLPPAVVLGVSLESEVICRLHARHEHGGGEILVYGNGDYGWGGKRLRSCRQLMRELYGRDSGLTHDRYFRLGRWGSPVPPATILEAMGGEAIYVDVEGLSRGAHGPRRTCPGSAGRGYLGTSMETTILEALGLDPGWVQPTAPRALPVQPWAAYLEEKVSWRRKEPVTLGFDLGARAHEVRKLLYKGFGSWMARSGYDPEDVLQEVYKGLLTRAQGKSVFNPSKSSFGHYIHMVCQSVLANYHRKRGRRRDYEQVGMLGLDTELGHLAHMDAGLASDMMDGSLMLLSGGVPDAECQAGWGMALGSMEDHLQEQGIGELAIQTLRYTTQGYSRAEIAGELGEDAGRVGRALAKLRKAAVTWDA